MKKFLLFFQPTFVIVFFLAFGYAFMGLAPNAFADESNIMALAAANVPVEDSYEDSLMNATTAEYNNYMSMGLKDLNDIPHKTKWFFTSDYSLPVWVTNTVEIDIFYHGYEQTSIYINFISFLLCIITLVGILYIILKVSRKNK